MKLGAALEKPSSVSGGSSGSTGYVGLSEPASADRTNRDRPYQETGHIKKQANASPEADNHEHVLGHAGNGKIDFHEKSFAELRLERHRQSPDGGVRSQAFFCTGRR